MFEELTTYLKENLVPRIKEGFVIAGKSFINIFWDYVKDEAVLSARKSLKLITALMTTPEAEKKKQEIVDLIMLKINLPVVLRPFKGLIRKLIVNKIDEILHKIFGHAVDLVG